MTELEEKLINADLAYCSLFQSMTTVVRNLIKNRSLNTDKLRGRVVTVTSHPYKKEFYITMISKLDEYRVTLTLDELINELKDINT